jgi:hypothetical protein
MFKAILWDVDGNMAETERDGHRVAFGIPGRWDEHHYGELLNITGWRERRGWRPALPGGLKARPVGLDDLRGWYAQMQSVSQFP